MSQDAKHLRIGQFAFGDQTTLDPQNHWDFAQYSLSYMLYDRLIEKAADGSQPSLATEWRFLDPTTLELDLREDVKFHNGDAFTAESVKFTLERLSRGGLIQSFQWADLDEVEIVNDYQVRIKTTAPKGSIFTYLAEVPMLTPAAFDGERYQPIGTGAFVLESYDIGNQVSTAVRNADYWGGPDHLEQGNVERITIRSIPEPATQLAALLAGEVDVIQQVDPAFLPRLEANANTGTQFVIETNWYHIHLNSSRPPLDDPRVIEAINYAVDREFLAELIGGGTLPAGGNIPPGVLGYNPDLAPIPYDPDRARQLLAEAGLPDGLEIEISFKPAIHPRWPQFQEALAEQMAPAGIAVTLNRMAAGPFFNYRKSGEWHTYTQEYASYPVDPDVPLGDRLLANPFQDNFSDEETLELIRKARATTDQDDRVRLYQEAEVLMRERGPFIPLVFPGSTYGYRSDRIEHFQGNAQKIPDYRLVVMK
jgi:peptide/nickel transport system substrate-binding protein